MRGGHLDRRITVVRPVTQRDSFGQEVTNRVLVCHAWARVEATGGSEGHDADQHSATHQVVFTTRWIAGVRPTWGVEYEGRLYEVTDVAEIRRRRGLTITAYAREVAPGSVV